MKKLLIGITTAIVLSFSMTACSSGVSQEDYDAATAKVTELEG